MIIFGWCRLSGDWYLMACKYCPIGVVCYPLVQLTGDLAVITTFLAGVRPNVIRFRPISLGQSSTDDHSSHYTQVGRLGPARRLLASIFSDHHNDRS